MNLEELNAVTIKDSSLPPNITEFTSDFVGYSMYGLFDLFSGFDARWVAALSRPMQAFHSPAGARQQVTLVQGHTNSVQEFQRSVDHGLQHVRDFARAFIDDCGLKGPPTRYDNVEIYPGIRKFVWEYVVRMDLLLASLITVGITASGAKAILGAFKMKIVGTMVSYEGWSMDNTMVSKILNWPIPTSLTLLRGFLGTAGVGCRWIKGFSLVAKPLTVLLRGTDDSVFQMSTEAIEAFESLKHLVSTAPVIIVIDYTLAQTVLRKALRKSDEGLVVVATDGCSSGAGWAVYQYRESQKRPAGFGSCTFNEQEQNYGQPKSELYAVY